MKSFALNLAFKMRFTAIRKWPIPALRTKFPTPRGPKGVGPWNKANLHKVQLTGRGGYVKAGFHMIADPYCDLRSYGNQPLKFRIDRRITLSHSAYNKLALDC